MISDEVWTVSHYVAFATMKAASLILLLFLSLCLLFTDWPFRGFPTLQSISDARARPLKNCFLSLTEENLFWWSRVSLLLYLVS